MKKKSKLKAYLLLFAFGCHYGYVDRWISQLFFWVTLGGFGIWLFIDLFRVPMLVNRYNKELEFYNIHLDLK